MSLDDPNQLVELSYVSKAAHDVGLSSLVHLFDVARKWNRDHELTGALFYENGYFSQILEGRREDVFSFGAKFKKTIVIRFFIELNWMRLTKDYFPIGL